MAEIPERKEIHDESPVNEVNGIRRHNDRHYEKGRCECCQLNVAPKIVAVFPLAQIVADRAYVIAKETQKNVTPGIFSFPVVAMPVDR